MSEQYNSVVDQIENILIDGVQVNCPVIHRFTDGLYCREIFMPAGTIITSKIHMTQHPYIVSMGKVAVIKEDEGVQVITAPYFGITYPGTRRVLHVLEDTIWTTFHPVNIKPASESIEDIEEAVKKVEALIIKPHINELIINKQDKEILP